MVEKLIKRTIWVAQCACGKVKDVVTENPPKEKLTNCCGWVPYKEESFTGPDIKK